VPRRAVQGVEDLYDAMFEDEDSTKLQASAAAFPSLAFPSPPFSGRGGMPRRPLRTPASRPPTSAPGLALTESEARVARHRLETTAAARLAYGECELRKISAVVFEESTTTDNRTDGAAAAAARRCCLASKTPSASRRTSS